MTGQDATTRPTPAGAPSRPRTVSIAPQILFFRTIAALALAVAAVLIPEVGQNRFWLAAVLLFVCIPFAIWLETHYPVAENGWSEPLFDLAVAVTLVHLVPQIWYVILVIGLMIVQAPSVGASRFSFLFHSLFAVILTVGMTFAAVVHDVEGWQLPILAMVVLYPSIIFYSYWQATRSNELRDRAQTLHSLQLLAGGISHDFNNVLTAVMGHAELALLELDERHPARESLDEVVRGVDRASLLSRRLLKFSGRSPGATEQVFDLGAEIADLVALLKPAIPKGVGLEIDIRGGPHYIRADRGELQRVVLNVIMNAAEATGEAPNSISITVEATNRPDGAQRGVTVSVSDRGVGMPPAVRARLFDPFFTSKQSGHGLGLAGAQRIVQQHGGEIGVHSVEGSGTRVELRLPAQAPPAAATSLTTPVRGVSGGLALVVDDEPSVRTAVTRQLRELGFRSLVAEDASEAIAQFRRRAEEISLVILDLAMPGPDGWACLDAVRNVRPEVPIVICSGFDPAGANGRDLSGVTFLAKPFRMDVLRDTLAGLADCP